MRLLITIFFLILKISFTFSQTPKIDSLKKLITQQQVAGSVDAATLFELCGQYASLHPDTLKFYASLAESVARQSNNKDHLANANYLKALLLSKNGKTEDALLQIEHILHDSIGISDLVKIKCKLAKANYLVRLNKQKEAIEAGHSLLLYAENRKDKSLIVKTKTAIGWAYMELGQERNALNWFYSALDETKTEIPGFFPSATCLNMAAIYTNIGKVDSAEYFVTRAIKFSKQEGNLLFLANAYFVFANISIIKNDNSKAEQLMYQAIDIRKQIGDPFYIVSDMAEMSDFYSKTGQTEKGLKMIKEAIAIAQQHKLDGKLQLLYKQQAAIYLASGDMQNYAAALRKVIEIQDSLYNHNSANALAEMQTKYEVQKKENTIIQQELKLTKKNYFIYGTAGLLIATLFFVYVFNKNKRNTQILQLQKMEAKLKQQTTQAVMLAEEEERKRIAGDLHDSVAQKIVAAKMHLESLNHKLVAINEPEQKIFKNIHSLLEESSLEVRNLSHSMMPGAFSRSGLTDAVKDFLDKIAIPGLKIQFHASGAFEKISENRSLMIYRIIQECVQNVLKHSKASQMDVSLIAENNELDITIEDNGVGFDKEKISQNRLGIKNIRSRITYLNGTMDIHSKTGEGSLFAFFIPIIVA